MKIDELLDKLDDGVDKAWSLPGGKCVMDAEKVRGIIDDLRLNLPKEIPQAKAIVSDRMEIIKNAKEEAAQIVRSAEERARAMVTQDEITRRAQEKAAALLDEAQQKAREIRKGAADFSESLLRQTEESMGAAVMELRKARQVLKTPPKP